MNHKTTPPSDLDLWAAALLDAVRSMEAADRTFEALLAVPPGPADGERATTLLRLWSELKTAPFPAAAQERANRLTARMNLTAPVAGARFEQLLHNVLDELKRLFEAAPPAGRAVVLASDFTWLRDVHVSGVGSGRVGCPVGLHDGHPARCGLGESEMLLVGPARVLVLGDKRARWHVPHDVRDRTLQWESERRIQADQEAKMEDLREKRRQAEIDQSDWGKARRLEAVEKELAELKAAQSQLSESRHD